MMESMKIDSPAKGIYRFFIGATNTLIGLLSVLLMYAAAVGAPTVLPSLGIAWIGTLIAAILARREYFNPAVTIVVAGVWIALTMNGSTTGGAHSHVLLLYPLAIFIAAAFNGSLFALIVTIASIVTVTVWTIVDIVYEKPVLGHVTGPEVQLFAFAFNLVATNLIAHQLSNASRKIEIFREAEFSRKKEALETQSNFLATMSHEIRTPLHGIMGQAELLLDDSQLTDSQRDLAESIMRCTNYLNDLITDILNLKKIQEGKVMLEHRCFDLRVIINDVMKIFEGRSRSAGITFTSSCTGDIENEDQPLHVMGDDTRLQQVVFNLCSNALKFTPRGGKVTLDLLYKRKSKRSASVTISVKDTGCGIPKHKYESIFENFTQVDETITRKFGGTGLGLAISRSIIVDLMGGKLWLESDQNSGPNQGSTFYVAIPFTLPNQASLVEENETARRMRLSRDIVDCPIQLVDCLIVDDNSVNRKLCRAGCMKIGCTSVREASNGLEAIEKWEIMSTTKLNIILMDVHMSEMGGLEATRIILTKCLNRRKPIVIGLTADITAGVKEQCASVGMSEILHKPFRIDQLCELIRTIACRERDGNHCNDDDSNINDDDDDDTHIHTKKAIMMSKVRQDKYSVIDEDEGEGGRVTLLSSSN